MKTSKRFMVGALSAAILAGLATSASAAPFPFTFDPSAASPALSAHAAFTADNMTVSDNAKITIKPDGSMTEHGIFYVQGFTLNGSPVNSGVGPGQYGIYGVFDATGSGTFATSILTSFSFTLYGDPGGDTTFAADGSSVTDVGGTDFLLGTGGLIGGSGTVTGPPFNLAFQVNATFDNSAALPAQSGFYVSPSPIFYLKLDGSFTAVGGQLNNNGACPPTVADCVFVITGGGGTANFAPEPATLALLGTGLFGLGLSRRRRTS